MSHLVRLEGKHFVQTAHCALLILFKLYTLLRKFRTLLEWVDALMSKMLDDKVDWIPLRTYMIGRAPAMLKRGMFQHSLNPS